MTSTINAQALRRACPCTECIAMMAMKSGSYIPLMPAIAGRIRSVDLIGSSRLRVTWEDGHYRSIYRFADLILQFPPTPSAPSAT